MKPNSFETTLWSHVIILSHNDGAELIKLVSLRLEKSPDGLKLLLSYLYELENFQMLVHCLRKFIIEEFRNITGKWYHIYFWLEEGDILSLFHIIFGKLENEFINKLLWMCSLWIRFSWNIQLQDGNFIYQNPDWYPGTQIGIQEAKTRVGVQLAKSVSSKNY